MYQTRENIFGQRALFRVWKTDQGFVYSFVKWIASAHCDTD